MQAYIYSIVLIEKDSQVLLLRGKSGSYKLPVATIEKHESPFDAARWLARDLGVEGHCEIKNLIGIYLLSDPSENVSTFVFAFKGVTREAAVKKGEFVVKNQLEVLVEEEKQLANASIDSMVLKDYLLGKSCPLEILKRVEEVKL